MIKLNFTNINNAQLIGRLLPWWARGRRTALLLQALLHPLNSVHASFKKWALDKYIECHITAQKISLEWYLKYKLGYHFYNADDSFLITKGEQDDRPSDMEPSVDADTQATCISTGEWDNARLWNNSTLWYNEPGDWHRIDVKPNQIYVFAPAIVDTVEYNHDDYERDIRNIMSEYMVTFNKINIHIYDTLNSI